MMFPRWRVIAALLASITLLVAVRSGVAIDAVHLNLGMLEGEGWVAQKVTVQLNWLDEQHAGLMLQAQRVELPEGLGELSGVMLTCERARYTATEVTCPQGTLKAQSSVLGQQSIHTTFRYQFDTGRINAGLQGVRAYGGTLSVKADLSESGWQITSQGKALSLSAVTQQLVAAGLSIPAIEGSGRLDLTARMSGVASRLNKVNIDVRLTADEISDAEGSIAGENLDISLRADVEMKNNGMHVALDITGRQGALYIDPVFVEIPSQPLLLNTRFDWLNKEQRVLLQSFSFTHPGSVQIEADGQIDLAAGMSLRELRLEIRQAAFPSLYETYLQPWLFDTAAADLGTAGELSGTLRWQQGKLSRVSLAPRNLSVDDREGRFELTSINGRVQWSDSTVPVRSEIEWAGGSVYRVALGSTRLVFESGRDDVRLVQPVLLPVLDGSLEIDEFNMTFGADGPLRWQVNGLLEPLSLSQLSLALGWPELAGKLSGIIPDVRYDNGSLEVGGILLVRVFDGEVTLRNLKLEQPFGLVPRLQVDVRASQIDLETLTRTFSFGKIEGRLDGRVNGLQMESWQPVAFDAEFATPVDDSSRHRISQKAVDNISSIGGAGMGGALSRSFLRFFEDFPYSRLGIRCRLENGICDMGGVEPAAEGYYLVKGRLIPPRLDVIGYSDRVNWNTLIAQIMAVTGQQEMIVE